MNPLQKAHAPAERGALLRVFIGIIARGKSPNSQPWLCASEPLWQKEFCRFALSEARQSRALRFLGEGEPQILLHSFRYASALARTKKSIPKIGKAVKNIP